MSNKKSKKAHKRPVNPELVRTGSQRAHHYSWAMIIVVLLLISSLGVLLGKVNRAGEEAGLFEGIESSVPKTIDDSVVVKYSQQEVHDFFDQWMKPTIDELFEGRVGNPLIDQRFAEMNEVIRSRYQWQIHFNLIEGYIGFDPGDRVTYASSSLLANGKAGIEIFVPAYMDFIQGANIERSVLKVIFRAHLLCTLMHEMEHCALGHIEISQPTFEQVVEKEAIVWHNTCLYVIEPLVEQYDDEKIVGPTFWPIYLKWLEAGKDVDSPKWQEEIFDIYK